MFKINENIKIKTEILDNSPIYFIENFYEDVESVVDFFVSTESVIHKENLTPSFNQVYFDDRRHRIKSTQIEKIYKFLSNICNQTNSKQDTILTNLIRFKKHKFNDYINNFWFPHYDCGYTAILYLNKDDAVCGTNLYKQVNCDAYENFPEHYKPWKSKDNYEIIKTIEPKLNRMVLFDALKFCHGMNIENDRYFDSEYRMNQVFFFQKPEDLNSNKNILDRLFFGKKI